MKKFPNGYCHFRAGGTKREGATAPGLAAQYPWENSPRRSHLHRLHLHAYYIDRTPVTNVQFKQFLDATHYHPADDHNFLRDCSQGNFPAGCDAKPVPWVSLAYAIAISNAAG